MIRAELWDLAGVPLKAIPLDHEPIELKLPAPAPERFAYEPDAVPSFAPVPCRRFRRGPLIGRVRVYLEVPA